MSTPHTNEIAHAGNSDSFLPKNIFAGKDENIEEKKALANDIFEKLKESKGMIGKLKLSIFGSWIKDYLVSEGIWDSIKDGIKWAFLHSIFNNGWSFTINQKEYSDVFSFLEDTKKAITSATQENLNQLRQQIIVWDNHSSPQSHETITTPPSMEKDIKKIVETLETHGNLTTIKEIKDTEWNIILQWLWKTPYFNENAIQDLVGFALSFYQKTWEPLKISSAYRTIKHQKKLQEGNKDEIYTDNKGVSHVWVPTATPWYSNHQTWHAIDIAEASRDKLSETQLVALATAYNFRRDKNEPRHFNHKNMLSKSERLALSRKLQKNYETYRA